MIVAVLAVGEITTLLHRPLPLLGDSIETMRECQQNDSLADGYAWWPLANATPQTSVWDKCGMPRRISWQDRPALASPPTRRAARNRRPWRRGSAP